MPTFEEALKFASRAQKPRPRLCPICGTPLKGRQRTACSNRCHVALHRKNRREGKIEPQTPLPQAQAFTSVDDASQRCRDAIARFAGGLSSDDAGASGTMSSDADL